MDKDTPRDARNAPCLICESPDMTLWLELPREWSPPVCVCAGELGRVCQLDVRELAEVAYLIHYEEIGHE